jgi:hypothetical protein
LPEPVVQSYEPKCYQCGASWNGNLPPPHVCPACRSEWWGKDRQIENSVGVGNEYMIHEVTAPREDVVALSLLGVGFGHAPTVYLEGMLYRRLRETARTLGKPIADLNGFKIRFERDPSGKAGLSLTATGSIPRVTAT